MITELRNHPSYTIKHTNGSFLLFCFFSEMENLGLEIYKIPKDIEYPKQY